ncbi:MAG: ABC transporter permease [Prolixibacteraceae bacterium]
MQTLKAPFRGWGVIIMLLKFVIRNLKGRLFLNLTKVMGLALGLSGILFITLFLKNELSYDSFHQKANRIYRITTTNPALFNNAHFARIYNSEQIPDLAGYFPEIESYLRLAPIRGGVMMHNEKYYSINEAFVCDSTFFNLFNAQLLIGDQQTVLNAPGSMVVSASFAQKLFGNADPVGQVLTLPAGQFYGTASTFTIKGVMKDFPQNSHFHPDLITTPESGTISWWAWSYLLLKDHSTPENITSKYDEFLASITNQPVDKIKIEAHLQKITDIHLHSDKLREIEANGNMTNIFIMAVAALVLLLISMSNYASLNLGMAGFNQKFIAINRILGSSRNTNLNYFFIESLLIVILSLVLTFVFVLPTKLFIIKHFNINLLEGNVGLICSVLLIFSVLGIFAGLQPVWKQNFRKFYHKTSSNLLNKDSIFVSKGIIVTQFTLAIALIVSVMVISRQTNYALDHSMGVKENNIICFESVHASVQQKFEVFKAELLKYNTIESVSAIMEPPGGEANDIFHFEMEGFDASDEKQNNAIGVFPCDYSFPSIFKLQFLSGRNFKKTNADNEGSGEYIINETALHQLNFRKPDEAIGKSFKLISPVEGMNIPNGKIVGVVQDFHLSSMKKKVGPLVMFKRDKLWLINFVLAYKPGMREPALKSIQSVWSEMFPAYPFSYESVDAMYRKVYKTELLQTRLLSIFTFIAIFICSMGLLGISLLVSQQRVKEIGIRKVNGAKISEILTMLNKDFVKWVVIAFVIATPVAYYAMHLWLENFAYKTELSWWIFALAGLMALGIALLTVSWQSWKAATRNPVEALRYE